MMNRFTLFLPVFALLTFAAPAAEKRLVEVDDYFTQSYVSECVASPDGKFIAYVEQRWEIPQDTRNPDLWVVETETGKIRRLTFESAPDGHPVWSPDSTMLYFTSKRSRDENKVAPYNNKTQVWRIDIATGQLSPVTRLAEGIESFDLSADGNSLFYTVGEKTDDDEWEALRKAHDSVDYGHGERSTSQLWKLDLTSWRASKIVDEGKYIRQFQVSPDESLIAMITVPDDLLITHEGKSQVDLLTVKSGDISKVDDVLWRSFEKDRHGWLEELSWSGDGKRLAFRVVYDGYPAEIYCTETTTAKVWQVNRPEGVTVDGGRMLWNQGRLYFAGQKKARAHVYSVTGLKDGAQGESAAMTEGDIAVSDFGVSGAGQLSVVKADPQNSGDLFLVKTKSELKRLTTLNPQVADWKLPQISVVQWKGANGDTVEGILELPPGYDASKDKPLPTIVHIHGGPTSATLFQFQFWPYGRTLLPSKGFALFSPNYRGSTGYGDQFMIDLIGRENDIEVEDIMKGVDWLIAEGIADKDKLGVMGWSNGGFLTNALITHTNRFKAASSGAGVIDQVMQWGLEDTPGHVINYMDGSLPWDDPALYTKSSPLYGLGKVTTPTLIQVGENDVRVPASHARTLFRGLSRYGKAPTQLIVFPDAGHSPITYPHRKAKMEWDVAWFEKYLMGKDPTEEKE